jgi:hypothetical protein
MASRDAQRKAWNEAMRTAAGATALPPALQPHTQKRRSDRHKKQERRDKARRVQTMSEDKDFRAAVWLDALEEVDPSAPTGDDDVEYDELDELEERKNKRRRGGNAKPKTGILPKRFRPRSLASILVEEATREDGVARDFLQAEARLPPHQQLSPRKFCPVTGLEGIYTEPKSGIPYASLKALEQIRERPPPWMTLTGSAAFYEATKSLLDEES